MNGNYDDKPSDGIVLLVVGILLVIAIAGSCHG